MKKRLVGASLGILLFSGCGGAAPAPDKPVQVDKSTFESEVERYLQAYAQQQTYDRAQELTDGKPENFNAWLNGGRAVLPKAGEDEGRHADNDAFTKLAILQLEGTPVVISSTTASGDRFSAIQLFDDHNYNYKNILRPQGKITLYHGQKPSSVEGEAIAVPSPLSVVRVLVEVKDKGNAADMKAAQDIYDGITISGAKPAQFPTTDALTGFADDVVAEANKRLERSARTLDWRTAAAGPGQVLGKDVSFAQHAAATREAWGTPGASHAASQSFKVDASGNVLDGNRGVYSATTAEPLVEGFWSVTVYDTVRGGLFHPNASDRYHVNNTTAVKNGDGTVTFLFKRACDAKDKNCLEVPAGPFDVVARYYLPQQSITGGKWGFPAIQLSSK